MEPHLTCINARDDDFRHIEHCIGILLTHIQLTSEQKTSKSFITNLVSRKVTLACNDAHGSFLPGPRVLIMSPEFTVVLFLLFIIVSPSHLYSLVLTSLSPSLALNENILMFNCAGPPNSPKVMSHITSCQTALEPFTTCPSSFKSNCFQRLYLPGSPSKWPASQEFSY